MRDFKMKNKSSANKIIQSYKKRQQMGPFLIGGLAVVLAIFGIFMLAMWLTGPNKPNINIALFASRTPTATSTYTPTPVTPTPLPTDTPTITMTPTETMTPTASAPFEYIVQEGDLGYTIAEKFNTDWQIILKLNNLPADALIKVGDKLIIPPPDMKLPTETPVPAGFRGKIEYVIQPGDSLDIIAQRFQAIRDDIIRDNNIKDPATIYVGQVLIIQAGRATAVPTSVPTSGVLPSNTPTTQGAASGIETPAVIQAP
jgi:LysM repeat protein